MHHITLKCAQCDKEFRLTRAAYKNRMKRRKVPLFFCKRRCWGEYVAINYGFRRKYDYAAVQELWARTKWTVTKVAAHLGLPRSGVSKALQRFQEYRQYRLALASRKYD